MKPKITLLITCCGGAMIPAMIAELRRSEIFRYRLLGADANLPVGPQRLLDGVYRIPLGRDRKYIPILCDLLAREKVDVILPGSDEEAFAVAAALAEIERTGAKAIVSPAATLDLIADKHRTYTSLAKAGLMLPEYTLTNDAAGLREAIEVYGFPRRTVVFKPARGRGGRGLYVLCGEDDPPEWLGGGARERRLEAFSLNEDALASLMEGPTLVMPRLDVPAYDADVLALGAGSYAVVVRRRANPAGIPFKGNTILADADVTEYCRSVASVLELNGLHDIDLMTGPDGHPVVLEVNPRPSGSLSAAMAAGFPMIDWAVARLLGVPFTSREPERQMEVLCFQGTFAVPSMEK